MSAFEKDYPELAEMFQAFQNGIETQNYPAFKTIANPAEVLNSWITGTIFRMTASDTDATLADIAAGLRMVADAIDPPPMVEAMREVADALERSKLATPQPRSAKRANEDGIMTTKTPCINLQNGLPHCLHFQEGDGDCCTCGKDLQHCDNCGWAGDARAVTDPSDDANLCPDCGDFICASSRTEDCRAEEAKL